MQAAIIILENSLHTVETNEPINRQEGKTEQADFQAEAAVEIRQALHVLRGITEIQKQAEDLDQWCPSSL